MFTTERPDIVETESTAAAGTCGDTRDNILRDVLSKPLRSTKQEVTLVGEDTTESKSINGVVIGRVAEVANSIVRIDYPGNPSGKPLPTLSTHAISKEDIGKEVALVFEAGDPRRPVLIGFIQQLLADDKKTLAPSKAPTAKSAVNVELNAEQLTFTADKEIVLRCGKSSITLTRAGKILLRGAYLLSRSSGVNRIKGGSVQIN